MDHNNIIYQRLTEIFGDEKLNKITTAIEVITTKYSHKSEEFQVEQAVDYMFEISDQEENDSHSDVNSSSNNSSNTSTESMKRSYNYAFNEHEEDDDELCGVYTKKYHDNKHPKLDDEVIRQAGKKPSDNEVKSVSTASDEGLIEIDLGVKFLSKLENIFGNNVTVKDGAVFLGDMKLNTNITVSKELEEQLYTLCLESIHKQLKEECLSISNENLEKFQQIDVPKYNVILYCEEVSIISQDIVEIEKALWEYKQELSTLGETFPETIMYDVAKDVLCSLFPIINREWVVDLFVEHRSNLHETITVLKEMFKEKVNDKELVKQCKNLLAKAQQKIDELFKINPVNEPLNPKLNETETKLAAFEESENCREIARHHTRLKDQCVAKAHYAIQRNEHGIGFYFAQIADLHKKKIEFYNSRAANCLVEAHNINQHAENTLDLHYLYTAEAMESLDVFLDQRIHKLQASQQLCENVYIITGRGNNSHNGIPAIKIRAKARLRERNLEYSEANPGLLKVKIFHDSSFTKTKIPFVLLH